jgi:hypothetical protein
MENREQASKILYTLYHEKCKDSYSPWDIHDKAAQILLHASLWLRWNPVQYYNRITSKIGYPLSKSLQGIK